MADSSPAAASSGGVTRIRVLTINETPAQEVCCVASGIMAMPEATFVEIIARLPMRSIARLKPVCKQWRSFIEESSYLRSRFVSLHRNSSSSWSLMFQSGHHGPTVEEAIGFHGCKTWDLPRSPASYLTPFKPYPNLPASRYRYVDSSHGLVWIEVEVDCYDSKSFVGYPVSQDWVEIPPTPYRFTRPSSLVTSFVNGVVSSFKAVRTDQWRTCVYSSETGKWTFNYLPSYCSGLRNYLNLNGMLYVWEDITCDTGYGVLVAHDLYGDDGYRIIPLPAPEGNYLFRTLTTSGGDIMYVEILASCEKWNVWKLKSNNSDGEWWQSTRTGDTIDFYFSPLGIHPFDSDLIYLWCIHEPGVTSINLRTQEFTAYNTSNTTYNPDFFGTISPIVLPQWMDPVPRPPNCFHLG